MWGRREGERTGGGGGYNMGRRVIRERKWRWIMGTFSKITLVTKDGGMGGGWGRDGWWRGRQTDER